MAGLPWGSLTLSLMLVVLSGACSPGNAQDHGWMFTGQSRDNRPCRAVIPAASPETVSTRLLKNNDGLMVLAVGNPTWDHSGDTLSVQLKIDDGDFIELVGLPAGPVVFHLIEDIAIEQRLRDAKLLVWRLPWGTYRAPVSGVGLAYDSIGICRE